MTGNFREIVDEKGREAYDKKRAKKAKKFHTGDSTFKANKIMQTFDTDGNKKISWDEAKAAFTKACTIQGELDNACMKDGQQMFKAVNTTKGDGGLTWKEVKDALEATGTKARKPKPAPALAQLT